MLIYEQYLPSTFQDVDQVVEDILKSIKHKFQFMSDRYLFNINFMLREILNNAVEHGNHFDPNKKVFCKVSYDVPLLVFIIKDEGKGINILDIPTETHDPKTLLRERNRGHKTIIDMDFDILVLGTEVKIILNLNQEVLQWKNNY